MEEIDQADDQSEEEVQDDQSESEVDTQSTQGDESDAVSEGNDLGRLVEGLDGDYDVDQVKDYIEKGKKYGELQSEFTRKSQELADLRNKVEQIEQQTTMSPQEVEDQKIIEEVAKRASEMNNSQEEIEDMKTELELVSLRNNYGVEQDEAQETLRYAAEKKIGSLEEAYKAMKYDEVNKGKSKQKQNVEKSKKKAQGASGESEAPKKAKPWLTKFDPEKDAGKSISQLADEAKAELLKASKSGK